MLIAQSQINMSIHIRGKENIEIYSFLFITVVKH